MVVLCTIPDAVVAIQQIRHWLSPKGELIVLEHIRAQRNWVALSQKVVTPLWKQLAQGCHLDRPTDHSLKANGFEAIKEEYFNAGVPFYAARMVRNA
ncbi:MAG: hypothetical protein AAF798_09550 [Bacteroidota bacterium]